ncbi:LytTR family DNA-binding domain-containing protein [Flavitalea sp. BT771]|uniref:LytR/AlgR family response regulator transcription factor n=1 Tax=Flavitalea sp. BT771 TaxID=3063329 RepID=UPI0026E29EB9|nr:LytTR family DNA-binding domain-containing protein [Flavitalea sp. BT771]MDO6431040.1 LytTR family DNA-binding domain-containing protein [Flavitalea sp. BT771]MDV6219947.1 LytTR family DNA-binding domain-containing protein [Flavitalea sp. BT771]
MNALHCLVVDDEPLAIDVVVTYLQRLEIRPVCCGNGIEALRRLQEGHFDLLFLDIEMPGLNGISLLKSLAHRPAVVITTAYRDFAVEGFELEVLDYLVKPFSFPRLQQTMEKFNRWKGVDHIFLKVDKELVKVAMKDILYIESRKDYVKVLTAAGEYLCHQTLTDITAKLPPEKFFRLHRSYTVALDKINLFVDNCVHIHGKAIPVSREHSQEVKRRLQA